MSMALEGARSQVECKDVETIRLREKISDLGERIKRLEGARSALEDQRKDIAFLNHELNDKENQCKELFSR